MKLKKTLLLFSAITMPAVSIIGTLSCSIYSGDRIINATENSFEGIYQGISRLIISKVKEEYPSNKKSFTFSSNEPATNISEAFTAWKHMNYADYTDITFSSRIRTSMFFEGTGKQMLFIDQSTNKETFLIARWPGDSIQGSSSPLTAKIDAQLTWSGNSDQYNPFVYERTNAAQAFSGGETKFIGPAFSKVVRELSFSQPNPNSLKYQFQNAIPTFFTHSQGLYVMKISLKMIELLSKKTSSHFPFDIPMQSYIMSLVTYINYKVDNFDFSDSETIEATANFLIDLNKKDNKTPSLKKDSLTDKNIKKINNELEVSEYLDATTMKKAALKIIKQPKNSRDTN